jgi:hypothetical protein
MARRSAASNEEYKVLAFGTLRPGNRRRRALVLPRYLREESGKATLRSREADAAHEVVKRWADLAAAGRLDRKETSTDAEFLHDVFGALGYTVHSAGTEAWQLERMYPVPGGLTADGALGQFRQGDLKDVVAVHLNFFIVKQLPTFPPDRYDEKCPWAPRAKLVDWIGERALKLSCTAEDLRPLGEAAGLKEPVHKWNPRERAELRAELDAAFFLLYGLSRKEAEYVLGTFRHDETDEPFGGDPKTMVLEAYDRLSGAGQKA